MGFLVGRVWIKKGFLVGRIGIKEGILSREDRDQRRDSLLGG